jgi:7,8-dihydropterin-6-yl-methyl-4-(beta-D-ribofuranosyl)aminobenzene 5'-phosphate synthase
LRSSLRSKLRALANFRNRDTIKAFQEIDPGHLIRAHCTGDRFYDLARQAMGEKVVHSAIGTRTRFIFQA